LACDPSLIEPRGDGCEQIKKCDFIDFQPKPAADIWQCRLKVPKTRENLGAAGQRRSSRCSPQPI